MVFYNFNDNIFNKMKIDFHIHSEYSKDSRSKIEEIIKFSIKNGFDAISITDHDSLEGSIQAIKYVKEKKLSLKIIPGIEIKTNCGEILAYNIKKDPNEREIFSLIKLLKQEGAIIAIPHPFDNLRKGTIKRDILNKIVDQIDFLEINSRCLPYMNLKTIKFAKSKNLKLIGGSDSHFLNEIGKVYTITEKEDIFNIKEVIGAGSYRNFIYLIKTKIIKIISKL